MAVNFAKLSNAVIASVAALQQLRSYRGRSGHCADIENV